MFATKGFTLGQVLIVCLCLLVGIEAGGKIYDQCKSKRKSKGRSTLISSQTVQYKGQTYFVEKPKGVIRILILGGSAAEGFGQVTEKSWGYLIQGRLNGMIQAPHQVEVINMAQGASTSADDYAKLFDSGLRLNPDLVIIYQGWNDLAAMTGNPGWTLHNAKNLLAETGAKGTSAAINIWLERNIFLVRKFSQIREDLEDLISQLMAWIQWVRFSAGEWVSGQNNLPVELLAHEFGQSRQTAAPILFETILAEREISADYMRYYPYYSKQFADVYRVFYWEHLHATAELLRDNGINALFVFQPDLLYEASRRPLNAAEEQVAGRLLTSRTDTWKQIVRDLYPEGIRMMRKEAGRAGFPFVDMNENARKYPAERLYSDNVHYTEVGNRWIAEELFTDILKTPIVKYLKLQGG